MTEKSNFSISTKLSATPKGPNIGLLIMGLVLFGFFLVTLIAYCKNSNDWFLKIILSFELILLLAVITIGIIKNLRSKPEAEHGPTNVFIDKFGVQVTNAPGRIISKIDAILLKQIILSREPLPAPEEIIIKGAAGEKSKTRKLSAEEKVSYVADMQKKIEQNDAILLEELSKIEKSLPEPNKEPATVLIEGKQEAQ